MAVGLLMQVCSPHWDNITPQSHTEQWKTGGLFYGMFPLLCVLHSVCNLCLIRYEVIVSIVIEVISNNISIFKCRPAKDTFDVFVFLLLFQ